MNKKKQSARITKLKAEIYDLRVRNEFLENRIAIMEAGKGFEIPKMNILTSYECNRLAARLGKIGGLAEIKKEIKKEVELVRGEIYKKGTWIFRHDCKFRVISATTNDVFYFGGGNAYFLESEETTIKERAELVHVEEENGKFWSDEKKDFLKLEDVYFKALNKNDFIDIYAQCDSDLLSKHANLRMDCDVLMIGEYGTLFNAMINKSSTLHKIKVTKEVFIKLLKL